VEDDSDEYWISRNEANSGTDEDMDYEEERVKNLQSRSSITHECAAVRMKPFILFFCSFPLNGFSSNRSLIILYRTHVGASSLDCKR